MNFIVVFLTALVVTLIVGLISKWAASLVASDRSARIAGFCVPLGFALGYYSYTGPAGPEAATAAAGAGGSIAALLCLWLKLLKPRAAGP